MLCCGATDGLTYVAVILKRRRKLWGFVIDRYPHETDVLKEKRNRFVVGEYPTNEAAHTELTKAMSYGSLFLVGRGVLEHTKKARS